MRCARTRYRWCRHEAVIGRVSNRAGSRWRQFQPKATRASKRSSIQRLSKHHRSTVAWRCEMKMLVTKMALATSVALAALFVAEGANAQAVYAQRNGEVYDSQVNPSYRYGPRVHVQPNDVVSGHSLIGRDPDPSIRNQLLREFNSEHPD